MLLELFREHLDALSGRRESPPVLAEDKRAHLAKSHQLEGIIIMAAGDGKRMDSQNTPKSFLNYQGKRLIGHILEPALMQFDKRDAMVMIREDDSFHDLQRHLDDKGVTVLYQASDSVDGYLAAFLKEFYFHWSSKILRQYGKLLVFPADIVFKKEPDFRDMLSYLDKKDFMLVMARQEGSEGKMFLKKGFGNEKSGWLEDFRIGEQESKEVQGYEPAVHTGGFVIDTDLLYNPLKLVPLVLAFLNNNGSIAAKKYFHSLNPFPSVGYYFIDGQFEGVNTPEDLARKPRWEINKPQAP